MTVLVGRRRIGKTSLLLKPTDGRPVSFFLFYKLVRIEHNNEWIDWGILKKKGEYFLTINKEWKNCSVSY
jgi:AAA+ ATPase superfamily predicted ATPase